MLPLSSFLKVFPFQQARVLLICSKLIFVIFTVFSLYEAQHWNESTFSRKIIITQVTLLFIHSLRGSRKCAEEMRVLPCLLQLPVSCSLVFWLFFCGCEYYGK